MSEDLFMKYLFEVWERVVSQALPKPRYLQLLLLVAVHTFIKEAVDVAICETHHGGEYDATNVFPRPIVTGISTIGMDHIEQLGPSIENIAWHKAGIFKFERPAFSTLQTSQTAAVLERRAKEKNVRLSFVDVDHSLPVNAAVLGPHVQRVNASLALALTRTFLNEKAPEGSRELTAQDVQMGVERFFWLGRFQQINQLSVQNAAHWFSQMVEREQGSAAVSA